MSDETGPAMDDEFTARMRRGLAAMAPREVARTRRIRRRAAGGAIGALAIAVVTVLGVQVVGAGAPGGVEAVPTPSPTVAPSPSPSQEASPSPSPAPPSTPEPEPEPTPPPGFEGVAAGVPIITVTSEGGFGDTGAAGGEPTIAHDVYVLCRGAGFVDTPWQTIDCTEEAPSTVVALLGFTTAAADGPRPRIVLSDGFTGTVRVVAPGVQPGGLGVGGVASVRLACGGSRIVDTIGGIPFDCEQRYDGRFVLELAAWGIPYAADQLVPRVVLADPDSAVIVRFVLDPAP